MNRIAVFIDGGNFFYLQREELDWWVDPSKLLSWIETQGEVADAYYYAGCDSHDNKQMGYHKALTYMGYSVITKSVKTVEYEDGTTGRKANLNTEMVADIFCQKDRFDELYLVSGDADFAGTLSRLKTLGKGFKVLSSGSFIANEMREIAGKNIIDLNSIQENIEKT